ncbi:unnamed protein product [Closterium sp. Naga37s-1]|nr:unnamed protein product [Closterium sp. Naga37s-1]
MRRRHSAFPTFASEAAREAALREAWWNKPISEDVKKWLKTWDTQDEQPAGEGTKGEEPTEEGQATRKNGGESAEKGGNEEALGKLQLLCRADMVHYLDVRDGWDLEQCECCFDRAVSYRAQRALNMMSLEDFRFHLHTQLPPSVPAAAPNRQSRAIREFTSQIPIEALGGRGGAPANIQFHWKCERAPFVCAEAMLLEWMAEPRVALVAELRAGRQQEDDSFASVLVQVLGVKETVDLQEGFGFFVQHVLSGGLEKAHGEEKRRGKGRAGGQDARGRGMGQMGPAADIGRMEDGRVAREVVMFPQLGSPEESWERGIRLMAEAMTRVVEGRSGMGEGSVAGMGMGRDEGSRRGMGGGTGSRRRMGGDRGSGRRMGGDRGSGRRMGGDRGSGRGMEEELYGMMGSAWGGARREEAEDGGSGGEWGGGGEGMVGEGAEGRDGEGGRDGKGEKWREHLKGRVWERVPQGRASFFLDGNNANKTRIEDAAIEKARKRLRQEVGGRGGRDRVARVRGEGEGGVGGEGGGVAAATADSAVKTTTTATADTTATAATGDKTANAGTNATAAAATPNVATKAGAAATPVNTNPVVAAFTYRAACILRWVRIYGSDFIPGKQCFKKNTQGKVRPMRHPLRDLPSLLVRLGAIPKPLDQSSIPLEWEEWPRGDEAAGKLPNDPSERSFRLGIVKESGSREEVGGKPSKQANPGGRQGGTARAMRGRGGRGGGRRGGRGGGSRGVDRGVDWGSGSGVGRDTAHGDDSPSFAEALAASVAPQNKKIPIVRCSADAEFLVEFAGYMVLPPSCSHCSKYITTFTYYLPALTLIATFAYQPASALFNRFVSVFPPHSPEFNDLLASLRMEPLPTDVPALLNLHVVRERAEQLPVFFLLLVELRWPKAVLQIEELKGVGRDEESGEESGEGCGRGRKATGKRGEKSGRRGGQRDGGGELVGEFGEVWEEVRSWCLAAMVAWPASLRLVGAGLGNPCEGSKHLGEGETRWGPKMWEKAVEMRYQEDQEKWGGAGGGSSWSSSGNSSSSGGSWWGWSGSKGKGKKEEEVAYLKPWPGGVNLVACLREMLLGEPCYRPASPAATSTPAAGSTGTLLNSTVAGKSAPEGSVRQRKTSAKDCSSARLGGAVCGALGCEIVEGGGVKLRSCSGCGKVAYCSRECQKAHWPFHKLTCKSKASSVVSGQVLVVQGQQP